MNEREARNLSLRLMEDAWAVYVTTVDENGFPQTRAMDNLRSKERFPKLTELFKNHEGDLWVLLSTNTSSAKMEQIRKKPTVSLYYCKPREFKGLMLSGKLEIVKDQELKKTVWHDYWTRYYSKGVDDPDFTLLSMYPLQAKGWHGEGKFHFTLKGKKR